jgi:uncharacterized protein YbjT (DUF2867 family)
MKIALTGATGFIGSHILTELVSHGHDVTALVRDEKQAAIVADRGSNAAVVDLYDRPAVDYGGFTIVSTPRHRARTPGRSPETRPQEERDGEPH